MLFIGSRAQRVAPRFTIPIPKLFALHDPQERPLDDPRHNDTPGKVDEHDRRSERPENVTDVAIVAVDDPARLLRELSNPRSKLVEVEGCPVRLLVEAVKFQVRHAESRCDRRGECGLTTARRPLHDDARQRMCTDTSFLGHRRSLQINQFTVTPHSVSFSTTHSALRRRVLHPEETRPQGYNPREAK